MRAIALAGAALAVVQLAGCSGSRDATVASFPDNSKEAYLLILMDPAPVSYTIRLNHFNPEEKTLGHTPFSAPRDFDSPLIDQPQYVARVVDPGTYVISAIQQQKMWGACFNKNTRQFTVKPGEALFLGEFRPQAHLAQIQAIATQKNELSKLSYDYTYYDEGIIPPQITTPGIGTPDFLLAKRYEAQSLAYLHGRLQPAVYKPVQYTTSMSCMW